MKNKAAGAVGIGAPGGSCEITTYVDDVETKVKVALLEQSIGHIDQTLIRVEKTLDKLDNQFVELRQEIKSDFRWVIGMIVGLSAFTVAGFGGILSVMAHGFHWI